jgi:hypothetical protein
MPGEGERAEELFGHLVGKHHTQRQSERATAPDGKLGNHPSPGGNGRHTVQARSICPSATDRIVMATAPARLMEAQDAT